MKDYLEFFGFQDDPFKITPDSHYFFLSESHQEALSSLKYLCETEEGFAVIIGEPGTGKTLTVRKFMDELPDNVEYAYILFPNLSPEELFEAILEDFGIKSEGETKNRLFARLRDFLIEKRKSGKKVLIIIDEAQNLPTETLEELRILSNLETSDQKLLQIVLLGQPELEEKLDSKELRQLKQRITVFAKLKSFTEEETKAYIDYRIAKAGGGNVRINPKVYKLVYSYSLGIPRIINILMERSLMAAFVDTSHEIKPLHVERAAESMGIRIKREKVSKSVLYFAVAGLIAAGAMLYIYKSMVANSPPQKKAQTLINSALVATNEGRKPRTENRVNRKAVVNVPMLNMREEPYLDSDVIYVLREGDEVEILENGPNTWLKVRYTRGDMEIEGWVNGKYLEKI